MLLYSICATHFHFMKVKQGRYLNYFLFLKLVNIHYSLFVNWRKFIFYSPYEFCIEYKLIKISDPDFAISDE